MYICDDIFFTTKTIQKMQFKTKILVLLTLLASATFFMSAALFTNVQNTAPLVAMPIEPALNNQLTAQEILEFSPRQVEEKLGRKLSIKEKIGFKIAQKKAKKANIGNEGGVKTQLTAFLLCFFLGVIGVHRFYMGYTGIGIVQILTLGGCGIWTLIDLIRIITLDLKCKDGSELTPW